MEPSNVRVHVQARGPAPFNSGGCLDSWFDWPNLTVFGSS